MITKSAISVDVKHNKENINNIIFSLCKYNLRETFNELLTDLKTDRELIEELSGNGNEDNSIYKFIVNRRNYSKQEEHYAYFFELLMDAGIGIPDDLEFTKNLVKKLHPDSISKLIHVSILDNLNKPEDSEEYKYTYEMLPYLLLNRDMVYYIFFDPDTPEDDNPIRETRFISDNLLFDAIDRFLESKMVVPTYELLLHYMFTYGPDKFATLEYCIDRTYRAGNVDMFVTSMEVTKDRAKELRKENYYTDLLYMYLFRAIKDRSMKFTKACFNLGADPDYCGKSGKTPRENIEEAKEGNRSDKRYHTVINKFLDNTEEDSDDNE